MSKKLVIKRAAVIAVNVFIYCFLIICLIGVTLTLTSKSDKDGTSTIFGMQMRYVLSPSMEKCDETDVSGFEIQDIRTKSMIFIDVVPDGAEEARAWYDALKIGDVLTFKFVYVRQETITHRIVAKELNEDGSGYLITLQGDNKATNSENLTQVIDTSLTDSPNYIIGKVIGQNYPLGVLVQALKTPVGMVCVIIIPALIILCVELFKIITLFSRDKHKKDAKIKEAQQNEIDELRRRLAELEQNKASGTPKEAEAPSDTEPNTEEKSQE